MSVIPNITAQVPHLITYQGRVLNGEQPFSGTGQFKFAIVGNGGTPTYWRNDGATGPGEPTVSASVPVANGLFTIVLGDANLPNMATLPPVVFANSDLYLRIWFNDGPHGFTQLAPDQRFTAVGYALMSDSVRDGAINGNKIAAGAVDASKLAAGTAQANLLASGTSAVGSGGVLLSADPNASALLSNGYVNIGQTTVGAAKSRWLTNGPPLGYLESLKRFNHVAVWSGTEMIIWGGTLNNSDYLNTGGRYNPATGTWTVINTNGAPLASYAIGAWCGSNMVVLHTVGDPFLPTVIGGRYNPMTDTWSSVSTNNAPPIGYFYSIVWTGTELILWEGRQQACRRYNPLTDSWRTIATNSVQWRDNASAIWTGTEMITWGGVSSGNFSGSPITNHNEGFRYNPSSDSWQSISTTNTPAGRYFHSAVWTGTEMIIWGGQSVARGGYSTNYNNGGRYNLMTDSWTQVGTNNAPVARYSHLAFWIGDRMIVWAGRNSTASFFDGALYYASSDSWSPITTTAAPANRYGNSTVWAGDEMIIWGGVADQYASKIFDIGARYFPASDSWLPTPPSGETSTRAEHTAIWTGKEMLIWGGTNGEYVLRTGGRFAPDATPAGKWSRTSVTNGPSARAGHSAVWTGAEMLVWGGYDGARQLNTGGRYAPAADSWMHHLGWLSAYLRQSADRYCNRWTVQSSHQGLVTYCHAQCAVTSLRPYCRLDRNGNDRLGRRLEWTGPRWPLQSVA